MSVTLSIGALRRHRACNLDVRIHDFAATYGRVPTDDEPIPLQMWWALQSTSVADRWWSLRGAPATTGAKMIGVRAACLAARRDRERHV